MRCRTGAVQGSLSLPMQVQERLTQRYAQVDIVYEVHREHEHGKHCSAIRSTREMKEPIFDLIPANSTSTN